MRVGVVGAQSQAGMAHVFKVHSTIQAVVERQPVAASTIDVRDLGVAQPSQTPGASKSIWIYARSGRALIP